MRIACHSSVSPLAAFLSAVIYLTVGSIAAQEGEPSKVTAQPSAGLRLVLSTDRQSYVIGVPIGVYAQLMNPTAEPIRPHSGFGWYGQAGTRPWLLGLPALRIGPRDEELHDYRPPGIPFSNVYFGPPRPIAPGAHLRTKVLVVTSEETRKALGVPGTLELSASFPQSRDAPAPRKAIESNALRITLVAPKGTDAEALDWLRERNLLPRLGYGSQCPEADFKAFLEKYPNTSYAPYAKFGIGQFHFAAKQYGRGLEVLRDLAEKHPKLSIAEDACYLVAESYRRLNNPTDAERWFREVIKRYPDTPAADDAKTALGEIAKERR